MQALPNGKFSLSINSSDFAKGLRKTAKTARNQHYLIQCSGAVGKDGLLQTISALDRIDTSDITDSFPYPQIFVEVNFVIVCSRTVIYELEDYNTLVGKLVTTPGSTWSLVAFHDFAYMSNGIVAVTRSVEDKTYSVDKTLPSAMTICNYNGQVLVGSPGAGYNI